MSIERLLLGVSAELIPLVLQGVIALFSGKDPYLEISKQRVSEIIPTPLESEKALSERLGVSTQELADLSRSIYNQIILSRNSSEIIT